MATGAGFAHFHESDGDRPVLPGNNGVLAAIGEDYDLISPHLREVTLKAGQVLCEPGEAIRYVWFLHSGAVSKLMAFEDGSEIECALIGREGVVGAASVLGLRRSVTRDVCHVGARVSRLEAQRLIEACGASPHIQEVVDRYMARKLCAAIRNGACNACHSVEQRLSRWLLTCSDVLESDEIALPQDVFAKMLGVQRTSVNPALRALQASGAVALARSRLSIRDRGVLTRRACECYQAMRREQGLSWALPDAEPATAAPLA
jgi:CRP-like cAMP-binding protein